MDTNSHECFWVAAAVFGVRRSATGRVRRHELGPPLLRVGIPVNTLKTLDILMRSQQNRCVDMPFAGQTIVLRWRMASNSSNSGESWRIDTVQIICERPTPTATATTTPPKSNTDGNCDLNCDAVSDGITDAVRAISYAITYSHDNTTAASYSYSADSPYPSTAPVA